MIASCISRNSRWFITTHSFIFIRLFFLSLAFVIVLHDLLPETRLFFFALCFFPILTLHPSLFAFFFSCQCSYTSSLRHSRDATTHQIHRQPRHKNPDPST